jgi:hypothetical protein
MSLREITDAGSASPPTSTAENRVTVGLCNKDDDRELAMSTTPSARELAVRENDGLRVQLLWHPGENALTVSVEDSRVGDRFQLAVAPDRALDAFHHPFAYAA